MVQFKDNPKYKKICIKDKNNKKRKVYVLRKNNLKGGFRLGELNPDIIKTKNNNYKFKDQDDKTIDNLYSIIYDIMSRHTNINSKIKQTAIKYYSRISFNLTNDKIKGDLFNKIDEIIKDIKKEYISCLCIGFIKPIDINTLINKYKKEIQQNPTKNIILINIHGSTADEDYNTGDNKIVTIVPEDDLCSRNVKNYTDEEYTIGTLGKIIFNIYKNGDTLFIHNDTEDKLSSVGEEFEKDMRCLEEYNQNYYYKLHYKKSMKDINLSFSSYKKNAISNNIVVLEKDTSNIELLYNDLLGNYTDKLNLKGNRLKLSEVIKKIKNYKEIYNDNENIYIVTSCRIISNKPSFYSIDHKFKNLLETNKHNEKYKIHIQILKNIFNSLKEDCKYLNTHYPYPKHCSNENVKLIDIIFGMNFDFFTNYEILRNKFDTIKDNNIKKIFYNLYLKEIQKNTKYIPYKKSKSSKNPLRVKTGLQKKHSGRTFKLISGFNKYAEISNEFLEKYSKYNNDLMDQN